MAEVGEGIAAIIVTFFKPKYIFAAIKEIKFESGIEVYEVDKNGSDDKLPPGSNPHWGAGKVYPAVYVREGGAGETKELKVKVKWNQKNCDGSAKLKAKSSDGKIIIEGDFSVSGERGDKTIPCKFTKKPNVVKNYGRGIDLEWEVTASGETATAIGGSPLRLFFLDAKPKKFGGDWTDPQPSGFGYKNHYLKVIDWATKWAEGKQGQASVLAALWDKFSDGSGARVPHITGYSYWKTEKCVQDLKTLITPGGGAGRKGWSCRAIAHTFMECLALHGITCLEVVPRTALGTYMFLVQNWNVRGTPITNWEQLPEDYFGGTWVNSNSPPLSKTTPTSLKKEVFGVGPVLPGNPPLVISKDEPLEIDCEKRPGVPAQGQQAPPLGFSNHWIVEVGGRLYDTSYGVCHANDIDTYRDSAVAVWLVGWKKDTYKGGFLWLFTKTSKAWRCHAQNKYNLIRQNGTSN